MAKLDQFIFTEDVQLGDVTDTFAQIAIVGPEAARVVARCTRRRRSRRSARCRSTAIAARRGRRGSRRSSRASTDAGEPGYDVYVESARRRRRSGARWSTPASAERRCRHCRGDSDRSGRAAVSPRHGRGDDSARSRHRVARDQLHQGLLRRAGSDHPRAAPRSRPRRAQARRPARSTATRCRRPARRFAPATGEIGRVTSSTWSPALKHADRARLRAPRFRRAGDGRWTVDGAAAKS